MRDAYKLTYEKIKLKLNHTRKKLLNLINISRKL